jgi:hypothetical protein
MSKKAYTAHARFKRGSKADKFNEQSKTRAGKMAVGNGLRKRG